MPDFLLPDLGEGLTDAVVVTWRVGEGDTVQVDDIVADVETAKAVVEVPVPFAGTVATLHAQAGQAVAVGSPLVTVTGADRTPANGSGFAEPGVVTAPVDHAVEESSGNVLIGYGTTTVPRRARRGRRSDAPAVRPRHGSGPVPVISPLVRRMARDAGLDLHRVTGTGPSGLVRRVDVQQALGSAAPAAPAPAPAPAERDGVTRTPLTGVRKLAAEKLARSRREIPEATVWVDVDATGFLAARRELNAADPTAPVSVLGLLARFVVLGLARYPQLNARIVDGELEQHTHVNLGFAAQTDRGLVVPVVHDAETLSTRQLSAALGERTAAARDGSLSPARLTGGTVTVNNYGVFGVDGSAAIINHPEVAIVGMGRLVERPWVVDGQLAVRTVTQLTIAFDHRACDGGVAGGFLRYVADCVEHPVVALGDA